MSTYEKHRKKEKEEDKKLRLKLKFISIGIFTVDIIKTIQKKYNCQKNFSAFKH